MLSVCWGFEISDGFNRYKKLCYFPTNKKSKKGSTSDGHAGPDLLWIQRWNFDEDGKIARPDDSPYAFC